MMLRPEPKDRTAVLAVGGLIGFNALIFFAFRKQTYIHIDAIHNVNVARSLFDSLTPGLGQLRFSGFPLLSLLIAPLAWFDALWTTGLAGSIVSVLCFIATGWFVFATAWRVTGAKTAAWLAFLFFALNPRLIYLFTTPVAEPLMTACAAGLAYGLVCWIQDRNWRPLACAAIAAIGGAFTSYDGWALGAASIVLVFALARSGRIFQTLLYASAVAVPPLLWFLSGPGRTTNPFSPGAAAGMNWVDSFREYFIDIAYSINPTILWLALGGIAAAWVLADRKPWRENTVLIALAAVPFAFDLWRQHSGVSTLQVTGLRYGVLMAATLPIFAAILVFSVFRIAEERRILALVMAATLFLPDPTPQAFREDAFDQFTINHFFMEGEAGRQVWIPDILDAADRLADRLNDEIVTQPHGIVLTDSPNVDPLVWRTGIPMRRFLSESNGERWNQNLRNIEPDVRWVIAKEGDPLWIAQWRFLSEHFREVNDSKTSSTVHLYRRP
jgi:hypothetical protein